MHDQRSVAVGLCGVLGKEMIPGKKAARQALVAYGWQKGSRKIQWCAFCEHYHMTKGGRRRPMKG